MNERPEHLDEHYGSQWEDAAMAADYPFRPPYPSALFDHLAARRVLDLGCGTGDVARTLAPRVRRVDALDRSAAMIELGRRLPGGDHPSLRWIVGAAETARFDGDYDVIVAGESFHWVDWWTVLPRLPLGPRGRLAIVERVEEPPPWHAALRALIRRYSTNTDFRPYDTVDELESRGLVRFEPAVTIPSEPFTQPLSAYVASLHSRNGLGRSRLGSNACTAFDRELSALVDADEVTLDVGARLHWANRD